MTSTAWAFLGVAALFAAGDWIAVIFGSKPLEYFCKPGATAALVATAVALDPVYDDRRWCFVAALVLSLAGDVFLMLPRDRFVFGLASFLLAHVAYTTGFLLHGGSAAEYVLGAVIVSALAVPLAQRFIGALRTRGERELVPAVVAYVAAIGVMVTTAIAGGNGWAIAGALLFMTSDSLIGESRFVAARPGQGLAIMVTYHLAQAALVVSLV